MILLAFGIITVCSLLLLYLYIQKSSPSIPIIATDINRDRNKENFTMENIGRENLIYLPGDCVRMMDDGREITIPCNLPEKVLF